MQTGGAMQGVNTIPTRTRPNALLAGVAVLAIAALVALMVWIGPLGSGGVETQGAVPVAGTVIHDDVGAVHTGLAPGYAAVHDNAGNAHAATGTAIVHDDAGNVNR